MNKRLLLTLLLTLVVLFSTSAIYASDVNGTDSITTNVVDVDSDLSTDIIDDSDVSTDSNAEPVSIDDESNNLSTDIESNIVEVSSSEKHVTELKDPTNTIYYKGSYSVILIDNDTGSPIISKTIHIVINGVSYNVTTDENGKASIDLSLNPGKYSSVVSFDGDTDYEASKITSTINILPTIVSKEVVKYYKGTAKYTATFYTENGTFLANTNVQVTVNGKTYTLKTNANGVASLAIDLKPGTYKVIAKDPITGYTLTTNFKILSTISANDLKKVYTDNKKFKAKFYKSNGKALAKKYIKFKVNGQTYKVKTNKNGYAQLSLKNLKKGTYTITSYNTANGLTQNNKIKVYKKVATSLTSNYYIFSKSQSRVIKVKLLHSLGYAPTKGKIIKFKINGKVYYKTTNKNSIAKLKLPSLKKGVYTVKYKFAGNSLYKASSATNRVAVITTKNPTVTVQSTTTFGHGANTPLKLLVKAGTVPLEKRTVTFKVNGQTYTKTTDKNGIVSLPINLPIGNYTVSYSIAKTSKVNGKSGSLPIKVKERVATSVTWESASSVYEGSQTFKVLLKDANGKAIAGQTVKLIINSKTYTATTASNGYASFKISLSHETYSISIQYPGSNDYLPSSASKTITVNITPANSKSGINEVNTITDLSAYLKATTHCEVGNAKIKTLVDSLTKGKTTTKAKATAIFNYVRDTLSYSFYYNTKYGAVGTLNAKTGNCVDHSHLLVAMFRTAGIPARYVHGYCKFSSGSSYRHVWVQVLIDNVWTIADATSSRNSLGSVSNWNTKSFTLYSKTASISF